MKQKMKRITALCLTAMLLLSLLPLAAAARDTGAVEQKLYVSKNMVLWADGANNWNGSHKTDAEDWKDLSGSRNSLGLGHIVDREDHFEHHWEDNGLYIDPQRGGFISCGGTRLRDSLVITNSFTVELVLGDITWEDTASPILFSTLNGAIALSAVRNPEGTVDLIFQNGEAQGEYFAARATVEDLSGITLAVTVDEDRNAFNSLLYVNGEKVGEGKTVNFTREDVNWFIFGCTEEEGRWGGLLHGIRMYARALTPAELAANAAADSFNYREGNVIELVQRYDPSLDQFITDWYRIDCVDSNDRIPINGETDMIPLRGFYGSTNLWEYLYPFPGDEISWEGARLERTDERELDWLGDPISSVYFMLMYDRVCQWANLKAAAFDQVRYLALAYRVDGEIDGVEVTAIGYDEDTQNEIDVTCTTLTTGPITGDGTGDVQYLAFRIDGQVTYELETLSRLHVRVKGMDRRGNDFDALYLTELSLFATEAELCAYTGLEPTEALPEPDTDPETEPDVKPDTEPDTEPETEPVTDVVPDENHGGSEPETESDRDSETTAPDNGAPDNGNADEGTTAVTPDPEKEGGCTATVGFGMIAILTAALILPVLKKRE